MLMIAFCRVCGSARAPERTGNGADERPRRAEEALEVPARVLLLQVRVFCKLSSTKNFGYTVAVYIHILRRGVGVGVVEDHSLGRFGGVSVFQACTEVKTTAGFVGGVGVGVVSQLSALRF